MFINLFIFQAASDTSGDLNEGQSSDSKTDVIINEDAVAKAVRENVQKEEINEPSGQEQSSSDQNNLEGDPENPVIRVCLFDMIP